ncbi:MAG: hypothetical protein WC606_02185 [Candidatus Absconditabacterales bacterium]
MPTKRTSAKKKTANITAKFSAKVPEAIMTECSHKRIYKKGGSAGALYFFGLIGAAIYFIGTATTFRIGVLGLLKALVRPVFLVYGALKYLGM